MSSEVTKKRSVSSEVIVETCSSEVKITEHCSEQIIKANNHFSTTESTEHQQDDLSLQDFIDAEINSRLSNITCEATSNITATEESEHYTCMSNNLTNKEPIEITTEAPEPELEITSNPEYEVTTNTKQDTHIFLENEKYFNSLQAPLKEETPIVKINEENSLLKNPEECKLERPPSIKDKLMLGSDEQMALLFSTTITSPAFTPTEENYDFLQAIKREQNSINEFEQIESMLSQEEKPEDDNSGEISPEDEREISQESDLSEPKNITVKSTIKVQDSIQLIEDEIKDLDFVRIDSPEDVGNGVNGDETDDCNQQYNIAENQFIVNDKNVINSQESSPLTPTAPSVVEKCDNTNKLILDLNSTTTNSIQTTMSETVEHSSNIIQDSNKTTQVKKKKSKKSKKDHEKENISVNDNLNYKDYVYIEDDLSQVNVRNLKKTYCDQSINGSNTIKKSEPIISTGVSIKQLCQSFGDLTSLPDENNGSHKNSTSSDSSPETRAKSMIDLRRLEEPIYTGVSVKALKSRFNKFDALTKKTIHVRSSDAGKAQTKFNGSAALIDQQNCKSCSKQVFQMEQIKAEKSIWHRNCFRCTECNKQLTVDTYESHEGTLYCKPHFKALFAPKVVEETQPTRPRKHEMIIRESQPVELPPDVVRASDKPDLGLEELQSLNVKERFQVFEHANDQQGGPQHGRVSPNVKRSPSILSKLAKFQAKGMDVGVSDDALNGIPVEQSSDESESDEELGEDADLIRAQRKSAQKEQPIVFDKLNDLKSRWESGSQMTKDERREECKQEIQSIRSRLFMGKQGKMKEMYQQAVMESESGANVKKLIPATEISDTAKSIKERFEKGENITNDSHKNMEEDMSIFEAGISKKSRDIFKELDATATKTTQMLPLQPVKSQSDIKRGFMTRQISDDVVKSSDCVDDVHIETSDITNKFKFFETYKAPETERKKFRITPPREGVVKENSPERDIYRDPDVVRAEETVEDPTIAEKTHTASKMLSIFRQLEEKNAHEQIPTGPKPLKCFTPPPEPARPESDSEEEEGETSEEEDESEPEPASDVVRALDKPTDEFLIQAQNAARAKQLRAKFEKWEENEVRREQRENNQSSINLSEEHSEEQIESAKTLRARFESMRETTTQSTESKSKVKVHRFVDMQISNEETCEGCAKRVYILERVECNSKVYHKQCFRCLQCKTVLRMDSYTLNQGMLYCLPHFRQLFKAKGDYEKGFGLDQHKAKWEQANGHATPAH